MGIDDDCSRRTHKGADMAVYRGSFHHPLSCISLLCSEDPTGTTDVPDTSYFARVEIDQVEGG